MEDAAEYVTGDQLYASIPQTRGFKVMMATLLSTVIISSKFIWNMMSFLGACAASGAIYLSLAMRIAAHGRC